MNLAKADKELLERELERMLIGDNARPGVARQTGWLPYHTLRSKGSQPGYPDWTLVRDRVVFIECKREKGILSDAQKHWLRALLLAGAEAYVIRPQHLQAIAQVLGARGNVLEAETPVGVIARALRAATRAEIAED